ncbi:hypothetical protein FGIG_12267 [Fasciola gigantica]|uniref:Tetraspanin n=1 Tax=Fasciola gigantica TaxID=46835 RepID=A0A504YEK4_FASGI|nr:hypothetical protein FGIG_12267 [Fasciola gigantica]
MTAEKCGSICVIFITSVLLFSASVALLYIASRSLILTSEYAVVSVKTHIRSTALLLLAAGILLFIVATLAFIACFKQSRLLLVLFYLTLLIVLFCEVGAVFLAVFYWSNLENDIKEIMKVMLAAFTTDRTANLEITKIQSTFHCCGAINYEDWNSTTYFEENHDYPPSCCQPKNVTHSVHTKHT